MGKLNNVIDGPWGDEATDTAIGDKSFLLLGIPSHKNKVNNTEKEENLKYECEVSEKKYIEDSQKLPLSQLYARYSRTYYSWKDRMYGCKKNGCIWHQDFKCFRKFLTTVGPRRYKNYTLDRIYNNDKEYAPGKVQWRDKYAQNSNKGNNVYLSYNGKTHTIAQWAKITNQPASRLYHRHSKGLSDEEVITGVAKTPKKIDQWSFLDSLEFDNDSLENIYRSGKYVNGGTLSREEFIVSYANEQLVLIADNYNYEETPKQHDIIKIEKLNFAIRETVKYMRKMKAEKRKFYFFRNV